MRTLDVAAGQFAASVDWRDNLAASTRLIEQSESTGHDLLVLPEGVLARFTDDFARIRDAAQPLDGPFVSGLLDATRGRHVTVVVGVHETSGTSRPYNTLVVLRDGSIVGTYRKLHLYDAFTGNESDHVTAAEDVPALIDVGGWRIGLMTCYDLRFPELPRLLTLAGAEALVLPAAWVRGPMKEHHWRTLVTARALDNTVYVVASGECGTRNIGQSMIVDPMGTPLAQASDQPGLISSTISAARLDAVRRSLPVLAHRRFDVDPRPRRSDPVTT